MKTHTEILLVTDGLFHPPLQARWALHRGLKKQPGFSFAHSQSLERVPVPLERFAALVLYYHHEKISPAALERLEGYVRGGGGILAIHSATASFKGEKRYFDILGGSFSGHGPVESFTCRRVANDIFAGCEDFTVYDELYLHDLRPDIHVHFTALMPASIQPGGQDVPVVWTRDAGAGRVCYAVPGHTTASMRLPAYQQFLRRGLQYAAGRL